MDLVRRNPTRSVNDLQNELTRLFEHPLFDLGRDSSTVETSQWVPRVDIQEQADKYSVKADIPGVDPEDIEVTMENGVLSIKGERSHESKEDEGGYRRVERSHGVFYRRFALPEDADPENIQARGRHGVLEIEIGKQEKARSRRIPVEH